MNPVVKALGHLGTGGAISALLDRIQYGSYDKDSISEKRVLNALFNMGLGAGGSKLIGSGHAPAGISMIATAPVKDVAMAAMKPLHDWSAYAEDRARTEKAKTALYTALGLGGLGLGGAAAFKALDHHKELQNRKDLGTINVTLPTKDPNDKETVVTLPLGDGRLPKSILAEINRDMKRRLRAGGDERTMRRI